MTTPAYLVLAGLGGYVLGSLPFGWLVARSRGVDIFKVGSGSSGATNVGRVLGAGPRNWVFTLDAAKGAVAAGWPFFFLLRFGPHGSDESAHAFRSLVTLMSVVSLSFALFGHSFSCFTRFRGGKGVATGAGGFLVLLPLPLLISTAVWLAGFFLSRYVSLASILSAIALPAAAWCLGYPPILNIAGTLVGLFVIWRHRSNIGRLLKGTESRH